LPEATETYENRQVQTSTEPPHQSQEVETIQNLGEQVSELPSEPSATTQVESIRDPIEIQISTEPDLFHQSPEVGSIQNLGESVSELSEPSAAADAGDKRPDNPTKPCSWPESFPKNYVILLREGEPTDYVADRGAASILGIITESCATFPAVDIRQWNVVESLHLEFVDSNMETFKLSSETVKFENRPEAAYVQADLKLEFL
jgi:hypothetical protein